MSEQRTIKKGAITYILGEKKQAGGTPVKTPEQIKQQAKDLKK